MKNFIPFISLITVLFVGKSAFAQTTGVGFGTTAPQALIHLENGHLKSTQTTAALGGVGLPTISPGFSAAFDNTNPPTDMRGTFTMVGTTGSGESTATITFKTPFTKAPTVVVSLGAPADFSAFTYSHTYVTSTTSDFTVHFYTSASTASQTFKFNYIVIE